MSRLGCSRVYCELTGNYTPNTVATESHPHSHPFYLIFLKMIFSLLLVLGCVLAVIVPNGMSDAITVTLETPSRHLVCGEILQLQFTVRNPFCLPEDRLFPIEFVLATKGPDGSLTAVGSLGVVDCCASLFCFLFFVFSLVVAAFRFD